VLINGKSPFEKLQKLFFSIEDLSV